MARKGIAGKSARRNGSLSELLKAISSNKEAARYGSFKVLKTLSEEEPELLYPKWDFFADLIHSDNTSFKFIAIHIIANLAGADRRNKFEKMFDKYYALLNDDSVIIAAHVAGQSGKIAKARPELQTKITRRLLAIDQTDHTQERKDLVKGYAVESFSEYFGEARNKKEIMKFARDQLNSKSPRTRKKAKEFLQKWELTGDNSRGLTK